MLLAVDIGNTETTIGVFDAQELIQTWRIATQPERTSDELALLITSFLRLVWNLLLGFSCRLDTTPREFLRVKGRHSYGDLRSP